MNALESVSPHLAERLRWAVESDHIRQASDGSLMYWLHSAYLPLAVAPEAIQQLLPEQRKGTMLLYGAGLGELAEAWMDSGGEAVSVWERDPFIFRLMLAQRDWSVEITSGRLRLYLGIDLLTLRHEQRDSVVAHPLLGHVYRNELVLLAEAEAKPVALVADGGLFVEDVSDALRGEGFAVYTIDLSRLSLEEITETVQRSEPKLLFRVNHLEGLAAFSEQSQLPTIEWEVDPSLTRICSAPPSSERTTVCTWRRKHVDTFRSAGFFNVHYLPLATNPTRRRLTPVPPEEKSTYEASISFVGASMADRTQSLRDDFARAWDSCFSHRTGEGYRVLDDILQEQRQDLSAYRIPEIVARRAPGLAVQLGELEPELIAGELAAAERRISYIQRLVPLGVKVWGDSGWRQVPGLSYQGPAEHGVTINKIYSNTLINIDLGRLYQLDIVTMRVFDILACGGFVLAEHSDALAELFVVGEEIDSWRTPDELVDKVDWYLNNRAVAVAMAQRGCRAVSERHTIQQRVRMMLKLSGVGAVARV